MLTFGSLFAGIGGFDLGLERAGFEVRWQVEIDPFCRAVLTKHWPTVRRFVDVHFVSRDQLEPVDLIAGGFPCQDLAPAGGRAGLEKGHRSGLWREFRRLVQELTPRFVLVENVHHTWRSWLPVVRSQLHEAGYASLPLCLRASDFGAPHERARVFLVASTHAHKHALRLERWRRSGEDGARAAEPADASMPERSELQRDSGWQPAPDADAQGELEPSGGLGQVGRWPCDCTWWATEPGVDPLVHGLPRRVDRRRRAQEAALGNAIIPQAAEWIGRRLQEAMSES